MTTVGRDHRRWLRQKPPGDTTAIHPATLLAPFVFLVHDLEEALQVERMNAIAQDTRRRLPGPIARQAGRLRYTRRSMGGIAAALLALQVGLTLWGRRSRRGEQVLSLVLKGRRANGLTHIGQAILLRRYVPGAATAPAITAVAGLALRSLKRDRIARFG
jgi:hypothetical protein